MSEHTPHMPHEKFEVSAERPANSHKEHDGHTHEALNENQKNLQEKIDEIRVEANQEAKTTEQIQQESAGRAGSQENEPAFINYELKEIAYQRLLKRARKHLSPYSRAMSKVIHQPVVDTASEAVAKTVGRPSGIIGGGLVALIGTSVYYYLTKHFGYGYNSFVFIILMGVGFTLGWCCEILYKSLRLLIKK
jgi:hypothetical protein